MVNVLDSNQIAAGVVGLFGVVHGINLWRTRKIDQSTQQINNAVNHVEPGMPTLTQRVDVLSDDIEMIKATALVTKHEVNGRFNTIDEKTDAIRGMVAELSDSQASILNELSKVRESVDRRKHIRKETN